MLARHARWLGSLIVVIATVIVAREASRAGAPPPPPPEIQAIIDKMHAGKPVTPDEQRAFQTWAMRHANGTAEHPDATPSPDQNVIMPPDVQAIMARMQQGQKPSAKDLARLKQWAAETKGQKEQLKADAKAAADALKAGEKAQGGPPPGVSTKPVPNPARLPGTLAVSVEQTSTGDRSKLVTKATASFDVNYGVRGADGDGVLHLAFESAPTGAWKVDVHSTGDSFHQKGCAPSDHQDFTRIDVGGSGKGLDGKAFVRGEVVRKNGDKRAWLSLDMPIGLMGSAGVTCPCGSGNQESAAALNLLALDRLRGDVPFNEGFGDMPVIGAGKILDSFPADVKARIEKASFDFDAGTLRAAAASGGRYKASATYKYKWTQDGALVESKVTLTFDVKLPTALKGKIIVTPPAPERAEEVTLSANVPGATHFAWTVTPEACPATGVGMEVEGVFKPDVPPTAPEASKEDPTWTFRALCDFRVTLVARDDDGATTEETRLVSVAPRKSGFTIKWEADVAETKAGIGALAKLAQDFGMNRCVEQTDMQLGENFDGWIHARHGARSLGSPDYSDDFTIGTVDDDGPFHGFGYIASQRLWIRRQFIVNRDLSSGPIFETNKRAGNGPNLERLRKSVEKHERIHSMLARAAVERGDPCKKLELLIVPDASSMTTKANSLVQRLDHRIAEATSEVLVGTEMQKDKAWQGDALICLSDSPLLFSCGPLWALGTPLGGFSEDSSRCTPAPEAKAFDAHGKRIDCSR